MQVYPVNTPPVPPASTMAQAVVVQTVQAPQQQVYVVPQSMGPTVQPVMVQTVPTQVMVPAPPPPQPTVIHTQWVTKPVAPVNCPIGLGESITTRGGHDFRKFFKSQNS